MLLMFALADANLAWMLVLAAVMAVEKNVAWGRRISAPLGVLLLGASAAVCLFGVVVA
jgi:predicted metal-binding membrane protein